MKRIFMLACLCIATLQTAFSQDTTVAQSKWQGGLELDFLPYITGGYFGAAWVGKKQVRLRVLTASVNKPDWSAPDGFTNHHINAYAAVADYFFKPNWKGFWLGGGPVYWRSTIQTDQQQQTASSNNLLLNGSAGYNFTFGKHFYLSPWAGLSLRVAGDKDVPVDNTTFTLPLWNPEASLKFGFVF
jgi:hypothetical protein